MLVGMVGAVVVASAAGAHRSATSLDRFVAYSRSSSVELDLTRSHARAAARVPPGPEVADFAVLHAYALDSRRRAQPEERRRRSTAELGTVLDRSRLMAGRTANPRAVDEITIGESLVALLHLGIGDHLNAASVTPAQLQLVDRNLNPGTPAGPNIRLRIVGIVRRPLDLGDLAASGGVVIETPAFDRAYTGTASQSSRRSCAWSPAMAPLTSRR